MEATPQTPQDMSTMLQSEDLIAGQAERLRDEVGAQAAVAVQTGSVIDQV